MILFLCGDVMLGRGIDQIMPAPGSPELYESHLRNAADYVVLAERANGPIPRSVDPAYVWGDAISEMSRRGSQVRIINLETALASAGSPWPDKGINYRMHPGNAACLTAAGIDVCVLGNNHVMDWGVPGLMETLETLDRLGIRHTGAGGSLREAVAPAVAQAMASPANRLRVLVYGFGSESSGIPSEWSAASDRPGLYVAEARKDIRRELETRLRRMRRGWDIAIASVHWGGNWGYGIPDWQIGLAHGLIDAGFDMVHGHSSHHVKGIEVFKGKPILYGCGDFLNDYEGISGYEEFRPDLSLMYFPEWDDSTGRFAGMRMVPMRVRRFQSVKATAKEAEWLGELLREISRPFGTRVALDKDGSCRIG